MIKRHLDAEIPFMATENILVECVKAGGNRQELHEKIRVHSMEAGKKVKVDGEANDLLDRIRADESFAAIHDKIDEIVNVQNFSGFAPQLVEEFFKEAVVPVRARSPAALNIKADIRV